MKSLYFIFLFHLNLLAMNSLNYIKSYAQQDYESYKRALIYCQNTRTFPLGQKMIQELENKGFDIRNHLIEQQHPQNNSVGIQSTGLPNKSTSTSRYAPLHKLDGMNYITLCSGLINLNQSDDYYKNYLQSLYGFALTKEGEINEPINLVKTFLLQTSNFHGPIHIYEVLFRREEYVALGLFWLALASLNEATRQQLYNSYKLLKDGKPNNLPTLNHAVARARTCFNLNRKEYGFFGQILTAMAYEQCSNFEHCPKIFYPCIDNAYLMAEHEKDQKQAKIVIAILQKLLSSDFSQVAWHLLTYCVKESFPLPQEREGLMNDLLMRPQWKALPASNFTIIPLRELLVYANRCNNIELRFNLYAFILAYEKQLRDAHPELPLAEFERQRENLIAEYDSSDPEKFLLKIRQYIYFGYVIYAYNELKKISTQRTGALKEMTHNFLQDLLKIENNQHITRFLNMVTQPYLNDIMVINEPQNIRFGKQLYEGPLNYNCYDTLMKEVDDNEIFSDEEISFILNFFNKDLSENAVRLEYAAKIKSCIKKLLERTTQNYLAFYDRLIELNKLELAN